MNMNHELDELHRIQKEAQECLNDIQGIAKIARRRHNVWWMFCKVLIQEWVKQQSFNRSKVNTEYMLREIKACISRFED
jgi:hypothetical protein